MNRRVAVSNSIFCVGAFWMVGMLIGIVFARYNSTTIAPNILGDIFMPASLGGTILSSAIPVCAVLFFNRVRCRPFIFTILVIDGFLFGFCNLFLSDHLKCTAFFVRIFYMFSQSCRSTLLLLLCPLLISDFFKRNQRTALLFISASVLICFFDYFFL